MPKSRLKCRTRKAGRSKDVSILVVRSPIHIIGSFGNPDFSVDKGGLIKRIGGSALLGLINPLAVLIPLIETGTVPESRDA